MKTRPRNVHDGPSTSKRITRSKTSTNGGENSPTIPMDLIIEILLRLPAKSIAKCRCVSKLWANILRRPDFTKLFLTSSYARPQLLISCVKKGELFLFTSSQDQNLNQKSSIDATSYHMKFPANLSTRVYGHVHGLVCLLVSEGMEKAVPMICNPSTRQSFPLPKLKTTRTWVNSFFGYDPIDKQYKVLSLTWPGPRRSRISEKHKVLTLGTKKLSWRMVDCLPHYSADHGICINGVLYYLALVDGAPPRGYTIACFDVRSEKYRFINKDEDMELLSDSMLVNYKGKLSVLLTHDLWIEELIRERTCFELWVLVDAERHEWSKHLYELPDSWKDDVGHAKLDYVGVTTTNEIVLSRRFPLDPFYVFYCNLERKTIKRVEIQRMDAFKNSKVHIFLNHVEDVKLMQAI
ncbi:hypothetical protein AALP_AA6G076700 [Arabis alpina]|uniref:F-box domain-containing protein n=1 Tax=Arabis alpina TaxID=50452 RepID=A0A087GMR0_ARAAL|nr:hypothetical protein AALP_AA6G076700 [Arabis alpina]